MKHFYKAILALMLLPLFSLAQSNYKPGYIVTLKGDTVRGFVNYREWNANPNSIDFKTTIADKEKRYTSAEIRFFSLNGLEAYRQYTGPVSMDYTDPGHIGNSRDTSLRVETVFLKVIQKGSKLALYSFADDIKLRFFIAESPKYNPVELGYKLYFNYDGAAANGQKGATVNENTYMRQLFALANKYQGPNDDFQWQIEHAGYNKDDLLEIVSKINHISKAEYERTHAPGGTPFNLFLGAGANIDNIKVPANTPYYAAGGRSFTSVLPAVSFGINFFANPSTRQLQFRLEVGVAQSQYKSSYDSKVSPYIPMKASFDELTFNIAPQIIYNFYNAENFKVYGGVGACFSFFKFSNAYLGSQSQPNTATDIETNKPYLFGTFDNTFLFKAGVQFNKHWGIYGQYLSGLGINKNGYYRLSSTSEQVGINYFFN